MTILAEHITEGGMLDMAYQQEPDSIVWMVRNDGVLIGMTYRREEEVIAWHQHKLGGTYTGTHEGAASKTYDYGLVESIATLPCSHSRRSSRNTWSAARWSLPRTSCT